MINQLDTSPANSVKGLRSGKPSQSVQDQSEQKIQL